MVCIDVQCVAKHRERKMVRCRSVSLRERRVGNRLAGVARGQLIAGMERAVQAIVNGALPGHGMVVRSFGIPSVLGLRTLQTYSALAGCYTRRTNQTRVRAKQHQNPPHQETGQRRSSESSRPRSNYPTLWCRKCGRVTIHKYLGVTCICLECGHVNGR